MLVAFTKSHERITLLEHVDKERLLMLKNETTFYCPSCNREVILKVGDRKTWHFAHRTLESCYDYVENETEYHLEGKKQLYKWFQQQGIPAELEYYLKDAKQRPDLLVTFNNQKYAIEYQCSQIPEWIVKKRTETYKKFHYIPIWIIGGTKVRQLSTDIFHLSSFHWLFACRTSNVYRPHLNFYCPQSKKFLILNNLLSVSTTRTMCHARYYNPTNLLFSKLLDSTPSPISQNSWLHVKRNWRTYRKHLSKSEKYLQAMLYRRRLPLYLFPPEAGIPVLFHEFIETPTYVWQSWIIECFIINRQLHDTFHDQAVIRAFQTLVNKGIFHLRSLLQVDERNEREAIMYYLQFLCDAKILHQRKIHHYTIINYGQLPKSEMEAKERDIHFLQVFANRSR